MVKCAFLGLGVMGYPMAGHLKHAGFEVAVWNRTGTKAQNWASEYDGKAETSIKKTVQGAEFVMICVGDDSDVYAVVEPAIESMSTNTVIVDHTTASAECARKCHGMAKAKSIGFVDAPISGGEAGAINGQLTIMCGGDQDDFEMGPSGAGQLTKMVNQICIAGLLQGLAEGVHFAQKAGLNVDEVVQAIGKGAAQSWQMDNRATADAVGADLFVTKMVDDYYADVQKMGGNRWDTSSLLKRLK